MDEDELDSLMARLEWALDDAQLPLPTDQDPGPVLDEQIAALGRAMGILHRELALLMARRDAPDGIAAKQSVTAGLTGGRPSSHG